MFTVCNGLGAGELTHTLSINATNIGSFKNCTKISGDITIIHTSIHGDPYTNTPKMEPAQLDVFKTVKEITGHLWIQTWPESMSSLSPFENLEIIRGRTKRGIRTVVVTKLNIDYLGLRSLKEISDGEVVIIKNQNLCYTEQSHWNRFFKSETQTAQVSENTNATTCGPDMCFACRDYSRGESCVDSCNILEGNPREAVMNKTCMECDPECLRMNGTATCRAPVRVSSSVKEKTLDIMLSTFRDIIDEHLNINTASNPFQKSQRFLHQQQL
ncbi:hypothetical protein XENOCAPTIV_026022 [Xenoophorus captivus]|uniref:Receptor L-domain domain-containing protein n=1 Tax=Xenoophorus captivus TaxID=1517983 RepID=A0ABV0S948_9TELE